MLIHQMTHPDYDVCSDDWEKWRYTYKGGRAFVEKYLKKYSSREDDTDFKDRKAVTYCPAFAKAAIDDVKNSIYQRVTDVMRNGGTESYADAITGKQGGVDKLGNSMDSFIGCKVLPELLTMGKVGIYVDMPTINQGASKKDTVNKRPYVYIYKTENIRSWIVDETDPTNFQAVLLQDYVNELDKETGFPIGIKERFRYLYKKDGRVEVVLFDDGGKIITDQPIVLDIKRIPFVCLELTNSLLVDIADYQISLLNLSSSDIGYVLKSNFPFYVEQYDPRGFGSPYIRPAGNEDTTTPGAQSTSDTAKSKEVKVGAAHGRAYPLGTDQPAFIHPSPEPIEASMKKQQQLKEEIRLLLNLAISNLRPQKTASAESKSFDEKSLESGLSYIGLTLETAERQLAEIWAEYENSKDVAVINYPDEYTLKTEEERRKEASEQLELRDKVASNLFRTELTKSAARILLSGKLNREQLDKVLNEISKSNGLSADYETVRQDIEAGILSAELGSKLRGYPSDQFEKAKVEHAERLARIALAQSEGAARGVGDTSADSNSGKDEKKASRQTDTKDSTHDPVRGKGR